MSKAAQPGAIGQTAAAAVIASPQGNSFDRQTNPGIISVADLRIDVQAHTVSRGDEPISLTPSEFQLLVALGSRAGQVVNYVTLVRLTLDYDAEPWEARELIKRHIFSLRKKVEPEPSAPRYVVNVRGVGYRLTAPGDLA